LFLSLLTAILGAKFGLIDRYGSDLPYWDQWDAEGARLFRPYVEGTLPAADLFAPHNEHRPLFTRLLALLLLEAGDRQWDGRIQLVANALLHASIALLLLGLVWHALPPLAVIPFTGFLALAFGSPVSWENTLVGFQSQFYFVLLFSTLHVGATLLARPRSWIWWVAPLAGMAALFSMASGVLSAVAILAAMAIRALRDRRFSSGDAYVVVGNALLIIAGWLLRVDVAGHAALKAGSPAVWLDAWLHQFSWPIVSLWAAPLGLVAPLATAVAYGRKQIDGPVALALLGGCAWFCLQAAAIAYARGAEGHGYASRYTDILAIGQVIGALALAYLAVTARQTRARVGWLVLTVAFMVVGVWGQSRQAGETQRNSLQVFPAVNEARIVSVRRYLANRDPAFFKKEPWDELPYPSAAYLAQLLDTPSIRALQPASVRPPPVFSVDASATRGFGAYANLRAAGPAPQDLNAWWAAAGTNARFVSTEFGVDLRRLSIFIAGEISGTADLRLIDAQGHVHRPLGPVATSPRWKRVNFPPVTGRCRLEVEYTGAGWFAFTQPVTQGNLSALALKSLQGGPFLLGLSGAFLLGAFMLLRPSRPPGTRAPTWHSARPQATGSNLPAG
jgi:hypothetical protein